MFLSDSNLQRVYQNKLKSIIRINSVTSPAPLFIPVLPLPATTVIILITLVMWALFTLLRSWSLLLTLNRLVPRSSLYVLPAVLRWLHAWISRNALLIRHRSLLLLLPWRSH